MKKPLIYPIFFMVIVTAVFIVVLATFNYITIDTIKFNNENELRHKILYVFNIIPDNEDPKIIEETFNKRVIEKKFGDITGYALINGSEEVAYAVPVNGPGLWGSITGYIGLNKDYTEIIGIEFVTQSETPGLGGRISEEDYKKQFRNLVIKETGGEDYINIDAISGATQTSTAVMKFINDDLREFFKTVEVSN